MTEGFELPIISLIPNNQKIKDLDVDNLHSIWIVYSKCKNKMENDKRLENMSWRLWYRESSLTKQQQNLSFIGTSQETVSPFIKNNQEIISPFIKTNQVRQSKFFIEDEEDFTDDDSSDDEYFSSWNECTINDNSTLILNDIKDKDIDELAFMKEFKKINPIQPTQQPRSLLTSLLNSQS